MFKIVKYYFLLNIYQRAKRNIIAVIISGFLLVLSSYIFNDLIDIADDSKYGLIIVKWILLLLLWSIIAFNIVKVLNAIPRPLKKENKNIVRDTRKESILHKEHLISRSGIILNKYKSSK